MNLEKYIDKNTAGVIVEFPSNPLIQLVDIEKIVKISHSMGAKVLVDNTIATPYNFNPFYYDVDITVHSTTKFLSGKNNHIGGVVLTKDHDSGEKIEEFNKLINIKMNFNDIRVLTRNIKQFERRMQIINDNSIKIANFLSSHKAIKRVHYPGLENNPDHALMKKYLKGGSGLLSFILDESTMENAEKFYDNLLPPVLKGPSLGSEKTLLSPYVIMAHYEDSKEELERLGFDFYLMRLSIGIEDAETIINSLNHALSYVK
jgi:cystathionine beta-lyase/cystathionine gamma-synthase